MRFERCAVSILKLGALWVLKILMAMHRQIVSNITKGSQNILMNNCIIITFNCQGSRTSGGTCTCISAWRDPDVAPPLLGVRVMPTSHLFALCRFQGLLSYCVKTIVLLVCGVLAAVNVHSSHEHKATISACSV